MTRYILTWLTVAAGATLVPGCSTSRPTAQETVQEVHQLALSYTAYTYFRPSEMLIRKDEAAEAILREGGRSLLVSEALVQARNGYNSRAFCDVWPPRFADLAPLELSALCDCKDFGPNGSVLLSPWAHVDAAGWSLFEEDDVFRLERKTLVDAEVPPERIESILKGADRVLRQTRLMDIMRHNNQVLDVVASATEIGIIAPAEDLRDEDRFVLLHFDTHSDLYVDEDLSENTEGIGDYVNVLVSKGIVDEVFWVLPDWSRRPEAEHILWSDEPLGEVDVDTAYTNGPRLLELYVDEKGDIGFGEPVSDDVPVRRIVKYHRITISELPPLRGERTFLDFDADYIGNSGFGTDGCINFNPTPSQIYGSFEAVFRKLEAAGAEPEIATLSISPGYTPDESIPIIQAFFQDVMEQTGHPDHRPRPRGGNRSGDPGDRSAP